MEILNKLNNSFVFAGNVQKFTHHFVSKITALFWKVFKSQSDISSAVPASSYFNALLITEHGKESIDWKLHLLKNAQESIEFSGNFCGGEIFRKALENTRYALAHSASLRARFLLSEDNLESADRSMLKALAQEFPDRFIYSITQRKIGLFPLFVSENHVKMLVVDEKYYVVGGSNFYSGVDTYGDGNDLPTEKRFPTSLADLVMSPYYRDFDLVGRGYETAKQLRTHFYQLFNKWNKQKSANTPVEYFPVLNCGVRLNALDLHDRLIKDVTLKVLRSEPSKKTNMISTELTRMIRSVKSTQRIFIGNFLFNLSDEMFVALNEAVNKQVDVNVITNGMLKTSPKSTYTYCHPHRMMSWALMRNHFKGYEFAVPQTTYHTKAMVAGDQAFVGSYNLGPRSERHDDELGLLIESAHCARAIERRLERDISLSKPMPRPDQAMLPFIQKFAGRIYRRFFSRHLA